VTPTPKQLKDITLLDLVALWLLKNDIPSNFHKNGTLMISGTKEDREAFITIDVVYDEDNGTVTLKIRYLHSPYKHDEDVMQLPIQAEPWYLGMKIQQYLEGYRSLYDCNLQLR
jgi:hypothetical protein